ncbi:hypothetical protein NHF45_03860 [Maricaulaceae bacterium NA33B04]|nr:hypothetical protein [Maricaulaceae bacterium NA33B04]
MMTLARFEALCDAHGGQIACWPEAERAEAIAFLQAHAEAAQPRLDAARALEDLLSQASIEAPSKALYQRVVAGGIAARQSRQPVWASVAAALMLTVGLGAGWLGGPDGTSYTDEVFASAFGAFETVDSLSLEEGA